MGRISQLFNVINQAVKDKGIFYVIKRASFILIYLAYHKLFSKQKFFTFKGKSYVYFHDIINNTWMNERSIEVPIAMEIVNQNKGKRILEIGNVLSNYYKVSHDIVDKYEKAPNVINQDVIDFKTNEKYDLIVSISTLEHVGWDEEPRDDKKISKALKNLKNCLNPKGIMIVTLPLGYNQALNSHLKNGTIKFYEQNYLLRIGNNSWREASWDEVKETTFGNPYPGANGLVVGIDRITY